MILNSQKERKRKVRWGATEDTQRSVTEKDTCALTARISIYILAFIVLYDTLLEIDVLVTLLSERIMNPLSGGSIAGLFSTHPPTEERVARLRALARGRIQ